MALEIIDKIKERIEAGNNFPCKWWCRKRENLLFDGSNRFNIQSEPSINDCLYYLYQYCSR